MKNLLYIGNKLSGKGKTVTTIEELGGRLEAQGYKVTYASSVANKLLRMVDMVMVFLKNYKRTNVVLIDTYSTINFYYAVCIAKLCRTVSVPYIPILHGGNLESRLKNNKNLCDKLFKGALVNVAPSGFLHHIFTNYGYNNITHIPNAIDLDGYTYKKRDKVQYKLLWVRSFAELYNPIMAVKVVEALVNKGVEVSLCMVGPDKDGSLLSCKQYAEAKKLPVTFTGKLSKKEWLDLSVAYDVFISTTTIDNTPVSVLEAMALGLPVISTNVGGVPYLIEDEVNGFLVPNNNVEAMVSKIEYLVANDEVVAAVSVNARNYVAQMDWNVVKNKWNTLLNSVS